MVVPYLVLIGVINIMLKTISAVLVIAVPVLIIWFFRMTKRSHLYFLHLTDYALALIMVGSESSFYSLIFCIFGRDMLLDVS